MYLISESWAGGNLARRRVGLLDKLCGHASQHIHHKSSKSLLNINNWDTTPYEGKEILSLVNIARYNTNLSVIHKSCNRNFISWNNYHKL